MRVLIVDDNKDIVDVLVEYVRNEGYSYVVAYEGNDAINKYDEYNPEVVLLDVMLPGINGFDVCKEIRKRSHTTSIIMITARDEDFEKIMGLEIGADDYIVKPFSPAEVIARIKAITRRVTNSINTSVLTIENLEINVENYEVMISGNSLDLTKKEFDILAILTKNHNKVYSRDDLLEQIWGFDYDGDNRTVDTHIKRLRKKLEPYEKRWEIKTIWGVGYKFVVNNDV